MSICTICETERRRFIMNNRPVCMRCDELTFDIEIECEEPSRTVKEQPTKRQEITSALTKERS